MEKITPRLTEFLPSTSDLPLRILTVGSEYLSTLRQKFKNAALFAVITPGSDDEDAAREKCRALDIRFSSLNIYEEVLPFPQNFFDYIVSDLTLEKAGNPQDIAAGFGTFIKPTGAWLTSFRNIRHWSVLADLMEGHYWHVVSRLYAKQEFERLLYASFYKEVRFLPQKRECPDDLTDKLTKAGFSNALDDMNTEFWLVYAARSMPELALLKSMYDEETRKKMSRIIHRIEYDVNTAEETAAFWLLADEKHIFADYAAAFAEQTVFHHRQFYEHLARHTDAIHDEKLTALLAAAKRESLNDAVKEFIASLESRHERK